MNKLLNLKAGEVLRNNHKLVQLYLSFRINYKFPFITGLNEAEESRNEDVDFKEYFSLSSHWYFLPAGIDCITYPLTLFNINLPVVIYKNL